MGAGGQVPEDFASFVTTHEGRLRSACRVLTNNGQVAEALELELLAAVALRWRWRRLRPGASGAYLDRLLRREARTWRAEAPRVTKTATKAIRVVELDTGPINRLAAHAWARAGSMRARRRLVAAGVAALLGCVAIVGPPPTAVGPGPYPPLPEPTALPAGMLALPDFAQLAGLPKRSTALPQAINADPRSATALANQPVSRAVAVLRQELGPLLVVALDGSTRRVDSPELSGALLLTTSLSPDGRRAALVVSGGLLVIDLTTGAVSSLAAGSTQPATPTLVWRSSRTVLLPGGDAAVEVNVDTGAIVPVAGINGRDVVSAEGAAAATLSELVATSAAIALPPRIRLWADAKAEDRPIFGPDWIGGWIGPGWSTEDFYVRACAPGNVDLPAQLGKARAAVGAVGANGLYAGTLVSLDTTTVDILGFADNRTVLLAAHSPQMASAILAWDPRAGTLELVTTVGSYVRLSVADLIAPS